MTNKRKDFTIYDIAQQLNLSPATISRGLKDHPSISAETKKRIMDYARQVGYQANKFATALRKRQTNTIGVIVPKLDSQFMSSALAGMEKVANKAGYSLIISQSLETSVKEKNNADIMFNSRVDGLIVSLAFDTTDISHFKPFISKNIPLIFFDRISEDLPSPAVTLNNFKAGYDATRHLAGEGCKRIAHITGNLLRNVYADRLSGYKAALKDAGLEYDERLVFFTRLDLQDGITVAEKLLELDPMPDGVFVANDLCAAACMQTLKMAGIRIPEDIAVVGFNNDPISAFVEPYLTTVRYPSELIGETAAKLLVDLLKGENLSLKDNKAVIDSELIIRASSLKSALKDSPTVVAKKKKIPLINQMEKLKQMADQKS